MTHIQFGWALPFESGNTSRSNQISAYQQGLDIIAGHFDSAWMGDHVQFGTTPVLDAWTTMSYLAALRPELKFGHLVLCQLFRNPAHLAKMAATLQYMSEGRFILGLGAGWHQEECDAYNFPFPSPGVRIEQLDEALHIIKTMWREDHVTFEGKHHQVKDANCLPKPDPIPPIMVAAFQPRMMRLTARHADWWNTQGLDLQKITSQVEAYEQACDTVGRDPATLKRTLQMGCYCAPTEKELKKLIKNKKINRNWSLVGTPEQIVEQLHPFIDLGFNYFIIGSDDFPRLTTLETLTNEVLPLLNN
jgi:alkanesulfonate monooxygenase SsuD/methylene tetrahydromethanopterin reductase-like flavin-dependent oxidoreductase (luciferase family)